MKLYLSADMEGVSGIVHPVQVIAGGEYEAARRLMTAEVNAAIEGALEAGAKEIVVNDSHGTMRNIVLEMLNPAARLIMGNRKKMCMMEGIDSTYQGAIFIGYHTRANTMGSLSHTLSSTAFSSIRINNREYGETEINALIAGYYGVPVIMVSGDDLLAEQVKEINPTIEYAIVKNVITQLAVDCLHPEKAKELIKEKVIKAISKINTIKPFQAAGPFYLEVEFKSISYADMVGFLPKTKRVGVNTIGYTVDNPAELMGALFIMANLVAAAMGS